MNNFEGAILTKIQNLVTLHVSNVNFSLYENWQKFDLNNSEYANIEHSLKIGLQLKTNLNFDNLKKARLDLRHCIKRGGHAIFFLLRNRFFLEILLWDTL